MDLGVEFSVFIAYAFGVLMIYCFGRLLIAPLKIIACCLANSAIGGLAIILINYFGACWDIFIPLNAITAVIVGILGVPGSIMLVLFF